MDAPSALSRTLLRLVASFCILFAACAVGENGQDASPDTSPRRFQLGMVVHNSEPTATVGFWSVVALGAFEAADSFNVDLEMRGDFDPIQLRLQESTPIARRASEDSRSASSNRCTLTAWRKSGSALAPLRMAWAIRA